VANNWLKARRDTLIDNALAPFALPLVAAPLVAVVLALAILPPPLIALFAALLVALSRRLNKKNPQFSVRSV
jgi:hypothetical protein